MVKTPDDDARQSLPLRFMTPIDMDMLVFIFYLRYFSSTNLRC
jgi:hypothetical protein